MYEVHASGTHCVQHSLHFIMVDNISAGNIIRSICAYLLIDRFET